MDWLKVAEQSGMTRADFAAERYAESLEEQRDAFKALLDDFRNILRDATEDSDGDDDRC